MYCSASKMPTSIGGEGLPLLGPSEVRGKAHLRVGMMLSGQTACTLHDCFYTGLYRAIMMTIELTQEVAHALKWS